MEHKEYWQTLLRKYDQDRLQLQRQIEEIDKRKDIAQQALKIIETEIIGAMDQSLPMPEVVITSNATFQDLSMSQSILTILRSNLKYLTGNEIYTKLIEGGYQSKSKNIKRDVHIALYKLKRAEKIAYDDSGKVRTYGIK